mmetsp:Transcript_4161/g.11942  ORF Transcript_4161/g.11942 Transcript_4161/m.11942 type:complete len:98 (-) Transcript_4161:282-575(-)
MWAAAMERETIHRGFNRHAIRAGWTELPPLPIRDWSRSGAVWRPFRRPGYWTSKQASKHASKHGTTKQESKQTVEQSFEGTPNAFSNAITILKAHQS